MRALRRLCLVLEGSTVTFNRDSVADCGVVTRSSSLEAIVRNWLSDLRIGVIAGMSAGAILLAAPSVRNLVRPSSADPSVGSASWTPPLVDSIQAASVALARGGSAFIAVAIGDSLQFPGIAPAAIDGAAHERVRMYSPQSTGLRGARWAAFEPRVVPYAAAYNAVVQVARTSARARS